MQPMLHKWCKESTVIFLYPALYDTVLFQQNYCTSSKKG